MPARFASSLELHCRSKTRGRHSSSATCAGKLSCKWPPLSQRRRDLSIFASGPSLPELWRSHANKGQPPPGANGPQYLKLRRSEIVSSQTRLFALEPKKVYRPQQSLVEDACA